ncbi:MAG: HAD-IC family P-type ATPase, partial [Desulfobulbaceae bacterium]|nr:HAD-IC family P-type ATPase [Desulfobulbaceae bacterium]
MFHHQPLKTLLKKLGTSTQGLTEDEASARLRQYGPNRILTETSINPLLIFINQFRNFIIYILLFAVLFSLLINEYIDSIIILIILITNSLIGFFQELSAEKSLESLKKISKTSAKVFRDGILLVVNSEELVIGDHIFLEAGDKVPADARLLSATRLKAEEAALTGESVPTDKETSIIEQDAPIGDRRNILFSSTNIVSGNCHAVVAATGMDTELGKITSLLTQSDKKLTPLQQRLEKFGKMLGIAIIFICIFIFSVCLAKEYMNNGLDNSIFISLAFITISLAVAAVPTALPAVVTIALSIGVKRLLKKKALVRKLSAVETLGSCDIICTDKTGTLTQNQMTVRYGWTPDNEGELSGGGYDPQGKISGTLTPLLFDIGRYCNNSSLRHK